MASKPRPNLTLATPLPSHRRTNPTSARNSAFHILGASDSSEDEADGNAPLPFPTALARRDFLDPDFDAASYLSNLFPTSDVRGPSAHRHQTLEDLRAELRERSSAITAELLELVNANYTGFLSLGDELKGGVDKVEDMRFALLGLRRQTEEIQGRVKGRRQDVTKLSTQLASVRSEIETGRLMLELDERLDPLEHDHTFQEMDDKSEYGEGEDPTTATDRLAKVTFQVQSLRNIEHIADELGRQVPFVKKAEERISRCRKDILRDLSELVKAARSNPEQGGGKLLDVLAIYRLMGCESDGLKALKQSRQTQ